MGAASSAAAAEPEDLVAGGNLGAAISYGDITAGGVGTVTSVVVRLKAGEALQRFAKIGDREFVVLVLKAVFRMSETQAYGVMLTAHRKGSCVIAVYTRDVAETKATEATELGRSKGYPLAFTTEPEE